MEYDAESNTDTDASRRQVLQTNELLESILAFLPPRNLFVVQRVSKSWRALIAGSPTIQRKMMLRLEELPRQTWRIVYDQTIRRMRMCRVDVDPTLTIPPPSHDHRRIRRTATPVSLSPHLTHSRNGPEYLRETAKGERVPLYALDGLAFGRNVSLLHTHIPNPSCYDFEVTLFFKFVPAIPSFICLAAQRISFQTRRSLKLGEALTKAMAVHTEVTLVAWEMPDPPAWRDRFGQDKHFKNVTVSDITNRLQAEHKCTAILCAGDSDTVFEPTSYMTLSNVFIPSEVQWAEGNAAHAKSTKRIQ
jgi:hypothetical protein